MKPTAKLDHLPPYLFAQLDALVQQKSNQGRKLWVLSKSDPDRPTHSQVVETLRETAVEPQNHHYPDFDGLAELREQVALWYQEQFGVTLDPDTEILPLLGSKEGIAHLSQALLDPGDLVLVPDPAFPTYKTGALLAGGEVFVLPLRPPHFLPSFGDIPPATAHKAKLLFLNYPNNPTGGIASPDFWQEALEFAGINDIILVNDHAYAMTKFSSQAAPSLLALPGSKERCLEFFTFSKAFHMAGWRLGIAVGNQELIRALKIVETHINAGIFNPIQFAGAAAMRLGLKPGFFDQDNRAYERRLTKLVNFFNQHGWNLETPKATVYLWVPAPQGMDGDAFSHYLLDSADVVVSPGSGFGALGRGYVRFCVTYADETVEGAIAAMAQTFSTHKIQGRPL